MLSQYLEQDRVSALNGVKLVAVRNLLFNHLGEEFTHLALYVVRGCMRVEYHSSNVCDQLIRLVESYPDIDLPVGSSLQTGNDVMKYDVEAFLAASKALFDMRSDKGGSLFAWLNSSELVVEKFKEVYDRYGDVFKDGGTTNVVRNSSIHTKKQMIDVGFSALVKNDGNGRVVSMPNLYSVAVGEELDLVDLFLDVAKDMSALVDSLISLIVAFARENWRPNTFYPAWKDTYIWRVAANFGPEGLTENSFLLSEIQS